MQIIKYKRLGKNKYKVFFSNNVELILYEDIILKYNLLTNKNLSLKELDELIEDNKYYEAYYLSINYIIYRKRCIKEIRDYLEKKDFEEKYINFVIEKLKEENVLNDKDYISSFINDKVSLSLDGPYKIKRALINLGFNEEDIDNYLSIIDNKIWEEKIEKIVQKKTKSTKNKSKYMFISKLKTDLFNLGYNEELIKNNIENIDYESNIKNDYLKATKKHKDKNKIKAYLLRKGYSYEEINAIKNNID